VQPAYIVIVYMSIVLTAHFIFCLEKIRIPVPSYRMTNGAQRQREGKDHAVASAMSIHVFVDL
jgi:hypothetical protein